MVKSMSAEQNHLFNRFGNSCDTTLQSETLIDRNQPYHMHQYSLVWYASQTYYPTVLYTYRSNPRPSKVSYENQIHGNYLPIWHILIRNLRLISSVGVDIGQSVKYQEACWQYFLRCFRASPAAAVLLSRFSKLCQHETSGQGAGVAVKHQCVLPMLVLQKVCKGIGTRTHVYTVEKIWFICFYILDYLLMKPKSYNTSTQMEFCGSPIIIRSLYKPKSR